MRWTRSHIPNVRPTAKTDGISTTTSGSEVLVYDQERFLIHRLDSTTATVWEHADGTRDVQAIADSLMASTGEPVSLEAIEQAVAELGDAGLLLQAIPQKRTVSRRMVFGAAAGAAIVSTYVPVVALTTGGFTDTIGQTELEQEFEEQHQQKLLIDAADESARNAADDVTVQPTEVPAVDPPINEIPVEQPAEEAESSSAPVEEPVAPPAEPNDTAEQPDSSADGGA